MSRDRRSQVEGLYHRAAGQGKGQRAAFLREACAGDDALRREVESLLEKTDSAGPTSVPTLEMSGKASARQAGADPTPRPSDTPRSRRAPWWLYVVATSYVALFTLIPYLVIWGLRTFWD